MRVPPLMTRLLRWLGFAAAALVVLFAAIQTGPGKRMMASLAGTLVSGGGVSVTISDVEGFIPANMRVGAITLADRHGEFARMEDLRLVWHPLALLSATIEIETLEAAKLSLARKPDLPPASAAASTGISYVGLPMRVALDRLAIGEIAIAEAVVGQAATLGFAASARIMEPARGLSLGFALDRRDAEGVAKGTLDYVPETQTLHIDVQAREPEGGLTARLAKMDGLPAIEAEIKGRGPLDTWNGTINFAAVGTAAISGATSIRREGKGHRVTLGINADVQQLVPANLAPLFEGVSKIAGTVLVDAPMRVQIETLTARTAGFGVSVTGTVDGAAGTADLAFDVTGGDAARFATLLPEPAWRSLHLDGTLRGAVARPVVAVNLTAQDLGASGYGARGLDVRAETNADGSGGLVWKVDGNADGPHARGAKAIEPLGEKGSFSLSGTVPAGGSATLTNARVNLAPLDLRFTGRVATGTVEGTLRLARLDLAALSPLAGRPLQGGLTLDADLTPDRAPGEIRVRMNGASKDVATGIPAVDGLFGGDAALAGAVVYGTDGAVAVDGLKLGAVGLSLNVDGRIDHKAANLSARASLPDLRRVDPRLEGRADAEATFGGSLDALTVKARLAVPEGSAVGKPVQQFALHLNARDLTGHPDADARLEGQIGGKPATGAASVSRAAAGTRAQLDLAIGSVVAKGGLSISSERLLAGRVAVAARDLSDLSAFALTELAGTAQANLDFTIEDGKQHIVVNAIADKVRAPGMALNAARINLSVVDPAGAPALDGKAEISGLLAQGLRVDKATLLANGKRDGSTALKLDTNVQDTLLAATARLTPSAETTVLRIDSLRAAKGRTSLTLSQPATLTLAGGAVTLDRLVLAAGGGSATVRGKAGETLDLEVDLRNLPLALAALADPRLDLSGTLTGTAKLSGPAATPSGSYDLTISRMSGPDLARAGVGPLNVKAKGALASGRVGLDVGVSGPSLSGLAVTGSVPMGGGAMDVNVKGSVALSIANAMLATSGARASGTAIIDAQIRGTPADPQAGGTVRITDARFDDTVNGVTLERIDGLITAADRSVMITSLTARTPNGGNVVVKGDVKLDPGGGFPGNMEITLQNARLVSSELMRLIADGQLAMSGAFATRPRLTGRFDVKSLDINIPDKLPGGADMLDVRHVNAEAGQNAPRRAAAGGKATGKNGSKTAVAGFAAALDLTINAPNNVFVRGMGIESELGGKLTLKGTSAAPVTVGALEMRRGRFDVLGRRLDFTRGKVTFNGTTDPGLDFVAETKSIDLTAKILVSGTASLPQVSFASTPELAQDEILARLLFNKSAGSLTASQAVQVAQTVAQFSGGRPGVLENVRRSLGVDSLDVGAGAAGGEIGVGKRLNDRLYLGVRQGTSPGSSKATIDIDITKNVRIQGATGADGGAETGVGMQWDY
jgi:translocation and assembly module TamB